MSKTKIKYLVLWVAGDCNLNCKYCYAHSSFTKQLMSFETAKKAIEFCNAKKFTLIFAGGEPLLNFNLIERVYKFLKENGYECKLGLQTNGTLITDEIALKLSKMDINIGVSFDADFEVNELLRGETKKLINGINLLKESGKRINLNCVLTDKSVNQMEKLIEIAYYFENVDGIGFDLLRLNERGIENNVNLPKSEDIFIYLKKAYEKGNQLFNITGKQVRIREIEEIKYRKENKCKAENYCYSSLGEAMVVTEKGDIYPCSSLVGKEGYFSGNILKNEDINIQKLSSGKKKECMKCQYNDICRGSCPARMIFNDKYNENKDCVLRKAIFKLLEF